MEQLLVNAVRAQDYQAQLTAVIETYGADFDAARIEVQLDTLHTHLKEVKDINLLDIVKYVKSLSPTLKSFFSEIVTLVTLILVMPVTNALSECSFSQLRRIKTHLRTTMSQERLNHCMILNAYQEELDSVNLVDVAKEFICNEQYLDIIKCHY